MASPTKTDIVSRDDELLILVDSGDVATGSMAKAACHAGRGVLHRALSVFILDPSGRVLLQRRHAGKRLWPGYWANSCCSHPRLGETTAAAARRRCDEELGLAVTLEFLFKFEYQAFFRDVGAEFELCSVFLGRSDRDPVVNTTEIADWRWESPDAIDRAMRDAPARFTPWFRLEWQRLRREFADRFAGAGAA